MIMLPDKNKKTKKTKRVWDKMEEKYETRIYKLCI